MTHNGDLTGIEVLEYLGIWNPNGKAKPNTRVITWLVKRELLPRKKLGDRTFRYSVKDCDWLREQVEKAGLNLMAKPVKY